MTENYLWLPSTCAVGLRRALGTVPGRQQPPHARWSDSRARRCNTEELPADHTCVWHQRPRTRRLWSCCPSFSVSGLKLQSHTEEILRILSLIPITTDSHFPSKFSQTLPHFSPCDFPRADLALYPGTHVPAAPLAQLRVTRSTPTSHNGLGLLS